MSIRSSKFFLLSLSGALLLAGCGGGGNLTDTTAPTVTLKAVPNTVSAVGSIALTATATDDVGVTKVEFYEGSTKLGEDVTAPYELSVPVSRANNGPHTYVATAYDAAGNKASASDSVVVAVPTGTGSVKGIIVDQNIGAPLAGSKVTVSSGGVPVDTVTTGADGSFDLSGLAAGTYDFKARKAGYSGSDVYGLVVGTDAVPLRIVQRPAFDTSATTDGAKLLLTRADGTTPLAGATFTDAVDFQIKAASDSNHLGPIRILYAQIGRTPGSGSVTGSATANNWNFTPRVDVSTTDSGAVTLPNAAFPNFINGFGSASGDPLYLEVLAVDFNYNYARYIVPITLINTSATAASTVVAPTQAAATAFTLKQEGQWTTPFTVPGAEAAVPSGNAADSNTGLYVELRWCYTNVAASAKPFAFDIERSSDGTTFTKIGTVGGGANAACSATNQALRPFNYRDNSASLAVGKTFTYRVTARGSNTASSNATQTTPLAQFSPVLLAPGNEATGVALYPTFVISQNQLTIGADGAGYNLQLRDTFSQSNQSLPAVGGNVLIRVEEGTGDTGNKVSAGNALVFLSGGSVLGKPAAGAVLTDTAGVYDAAKPNLAPVDSTAHTLALPFNLFSDKPLQPLRPYQWQMNSGLAYKYAPTEGNRISAYSVYTWQDGTVAPITATRAVNQNFDFITGAQ